jgi:hypothetical protein
MEEQIKIGFTGNRHGITQEQQFQIIEILDKYDNLIVSHGDCIGSDTDFHNICINYKNTHENKKIRIDIYPPDNPKLRAFNQGDLIMDEKPYLQRNLDIIKNSLVLIACPIDKNKEELRSGTWSTIRQARKQKLTIHIL